MSLPFWVCLRVPNWGYSGLGAATIGGSARPNRTAAGGETIVSNSQGARTWPARKTHYARATPGRHAPLLPVLDYGPSRTPFRAISDTIPMMPKNCPTSDRDAVRNEHCGEIPTCAVHPRTSARTAKDGARTLKDTTGAYRSVLLPPGFPMQTVGNVLG